ncbi:MAG: FAD-binding oxidoreductase [Phycisphaera sp.]|nr:MAG: FAD-binding oxidoreductase [Phycisphaera sp.]
MAHLPAFTQDQFEALRSRRSQLATDLGRVVEGEVRFGRHDRGLYSTDASIYQVEPLGVVVPSSVRDAAKAAEYCLREGIPLLPRGGGTSLAGQCTSEAVVLDLSARCTDVLSLDIPGKTCEVEAGITIDALNRAIEESGLFFAPDPATVRQATVGGCIGNNAAGTRSIKYGRTSENVEAVDVVLGSGSRAKLEQGAGVKDPVVRRLTESVIDIVNRHERLIDERYPKTLRRNAGYGLDTILMQIREGDALKTVNLASLVCGSEGTLAVTLGARLKLHTIPKERGLAVLAFDSLDEAMDAVPSLLSLEPSAIELLDDMVIKTALVNIEHRASVNLLPKPTRGDLKAILYVEFQGNDIAEFKEKYENLRSLTPGIASELHTSSESIARALRLRQAGEPLLHAIPGERKPLGFVEDNVVPVERLGEFVRAFRGIVESHGTTAAFYAHASVGVLHVRPLLNLRSQQDRESMVEIATKVADLAKSLGGVMSGEHGDGKARGPLLEQHFGPELMDAFREIKNVFDPDSLLNPGNIVQPALPETIAERTRVMPGDEQAAIPDIETYYDYANQDGFSHAVEMCNGAGVCRKTSSGTMCPSYMALRDERHSTRGRANAIRMALSGQLTGDQLSFNDKDTMETLALCLSCKGCKRECPSNVDVGKLKSEFTAQRFKRTRFPLTKLFFTKFRSINSSASRIPRLSNIPTKPGIVRSLLGLVSALPSGRSLPSSQPSLARDESWSVAHDTALPTVLLFGDCFSMYNETSIGLDAKTLLEAFGYRVMLADEGCCQRPAISNGFLPQAIREIDKLVGRLNTLASNCNAKAILAVEPSCLSAIQDEWLSLRCNTPLVERKRLADRMMLVEQFLDQYWDCHPRRPEFVQPAGRVLLHAHCHQKALWGGESSGRLLERAFTGKYSELDTGCCGMAGGFGMHKKRFDLSIQIGEMTLFPLVREVTEDDVLLATGTSCRHQLRDGVQYEAPHPVSYLRKQLVWRKQIEETGLAPRFARG